MFYNNIHGILNKFGLPRAKIEPVDIIDLLLESLVQHFISLIKDKHLDATSAESTTPKIIKIQ